MAMEPGWLTLPPMVPGVDPIATLARELARMAKQLGMAWTLTFVRHQLQEDNGLGVLCDELLLAAPGDERHVLLAVDQFEEALTLASSEARGQFARLLRSAMAGPVRVVGTLRPEFLGALLGDAELADLPTRTFPLRPLRREALASVIEGPAELADITVDSDLVSRLQGDTGTGDALPLLAFTLEQLAKGVRRGGQLSAARYEELRGVQGALITQAEAALADAIAISGRTRDQVIAGLLQLVSLEDERPVRRLVNRDELPAPVSAELDAFTDMRLVTASIQDDGKVALGVTHEAFFTAWPPLASAINAAAAALRARRAVERSAAEWDAAGRPAIRLWERGQLAAAVSDTGARRAALPANRRPDTESPSAHPLAARLRPYRRRGVVTDKVELSPRAREFLDQSIRRDRSRRWRATTVLSVLLVFSVAAATIAVVQQRAAQQQLRIATARQLIAEARTALEDDPIEALQLGIAAQAIDDSVETRASLVTSLLSTRLAGVLSGHRELVGAVAFVAGGRILISGADDNALGVWNFSDPVHPTQLTSIAQDNWVTALAASPDGTVVASGSVDSTVELWDLVDPSQPTRLAAFNAHNGRVRGLAFADAKTLVSGGEDGMLKVWDVTDASRPELLGTPVIGHRGPVRAIAISPGGQILATGGKDFMVRLWSLANRNRLTALGPPLRGHEYPVRSLAFRPDGRILASASDDHTARLWKVDGSRSGPIGKPLTGAQDEVTGVAFSPNGREVATVSDDQRARRWSVADPSNPELLAPLTGAHNELYSVTYTPDGSMLAAGARDGTILLWNIASGAFPSPFGSPFVGHEEGVDPVVFSPTGTFFATASEDMTVKFWDLNDPAHSSLLGSLPHEDEVTAAAFSPDHPHVFASGSGDTIQLWDVRNPAHASRLGEPLVGEEEAVVSLAFCKGRNLLVSGEEGGRARFWRVGDPKHAEALGQPLLLANDVDVDSVACSPDGRLIAVAGTGMVKLLTFDDQSRPVVFDTQVVGSGQAVNSVAFSSDSRTLAMAADDGLVTLLDVTDLTRLMKLGAPLPAHGDPVTSVAFDPADPHTMASAGEDGTARVWDLTNRTEPVALGPALIGHSGAVNSIAIGPNDKMVTGGEDNTARLWDLAGLDSIRQDPTRYACARTGRGFNPEEWNRQIPALPYQKTCQG
jgi:WD40 repeat protein